MKNLFSTPNWLKKLFLALIVCGLGVFLALAQASSQEDEEGADVDPPSQERSPEVPQGPAPNAGEGLFRPSSQTAQNAGATAEASKAQTRTGQLPSSLPQVKSDVASLQELSRNTGYHLSQCRRDCLSACRQEEDADCSQEQCDKGLCKTARGEHDRVQSSLQAAQRHLLELQTAKTSRENQALSKGTESALQHTRKAKKNMGLYIGMGVGTTALLTYMSYKCCSSGAALGYLPEKGVFNAHFFLAGLSQAGKTCLSFADYIVPSAEATESILPCSTLMCGVYVAGAAAAGFQTYKMIKQKKKLSKIEKALSDGSSAYDPDEDSPPDFTNAPGCAEDPQKCHETYCAINTEHSSCRRPEPGAVPPPAGEGGATAYAISPPGVDLRSRLSQIYAPEGGWPNGENPFDKHRDFNTAHLSPEQKKEINQAMAAHNSQVQDWLQSMGAEPIEEFEPEFSLASAGFQEEDSPSSSSNSPSAAPAPSMPSFVAEPAGDGPLPSSSGKGKKGKTKKKKGNLAKQMNAMLQKYYGQGSVKKDPYADQSVPVGASGTPVGAKNDNIFLRSHRRHQALIKSGAFVESSSMDTDTSDSL